MKKILLLFLTAILAFGFIDIQAYADPSTCARGAVVMDVKTGRVLFSQNPSLKLPMASTTKIMTTLVAIESGRLDEIVSIDKKAVGVEGSSIYLKEGEKLKVEDLLYGIMLRSGNDAATAIAIYIGGSVDGFVAMMNKKAKEIGAVNTHFTNPHGLDNNAHYTTAYDLALISSYALRNPKFKEIVSTKQKTIPGSVEQNGQRVMFNKNKMLWNFLGGDGVKTGYTIKSGRCLVSSATRNNWQLVCTVLDCHPWWQESSALLEYGFKNFKSQKIIDKNKVLRTVPVRFGKKDYVEIKPSTDFYIPIRQEDIGKIEMVPSLKRNNEAPILKGSSAGIMKIYISNKLMGTVNLEYCDTIQSSNPIYYIKKFLTSYKVIP